MPRLDTIQRREFKVLLPPQRIGPIREALQGICRPDPHATADGTYRVRTLYLDTVDLRLAAANAREQGERFKVRVRSYPDHPDSPVILEIKHRTGDVIRKTRHAIPAATWPALRHTLSPEDPSGLLHQLHLHDLQPAAMVEYDREAWVSELDDYARVTFDLDIRAAAPRGWGLDWPAGGGLVVDHGGEMLTPDPRVVLELKFAGAAPPWMTALVGRFDLRRHAFSKYLGALRTLRQGMPRREERVPAGPWLHREAGRA